MLYIWPFFAFFSAPLLISPVLSTVAGYISRAKRTTPLDSSTDSSALSSLRSIKPSAKSSKVPTTEPQETTTPSRSSATIKSSGQGSPFLNILYYLLSRKIYYPFYLLSTLILSAAIVKYNTIIHPFTLADNRHYMFYIFRYTILRSSSVRLGLVFAYALSRWLVWKRLEGNSPPTRDFGGEMRLQNVDNKMRRRDEFSASPFASDELAVTRHRFINRALDEGSSLRTTANNEKKEEQEEEFHIGTFTTLTSSPSSQPSPATSCPRTSTVLLWLLTTTLSLITAPLVEPRYFILPWVFYRLLVPAMPVPADLLSSRSSTAASSSSSSSSSSSDPSSTTATPAAAQHQQQQQTEKGLLWNLIHRTDLTLALETVWFLAINLGTMYMFLFKPFYWKNATTGEMLDGGRVQRFMW